MEAEAAGAAALAGVGAGGATTGGLYASMSTLTMRPSGPVPVIWPSGIPCSRASRLARGEARATERSAAGAGVDSCAGGAGGAA